MKTSKKLKILILLSTLTMSAVLKAETMNLPIISKPVILEEGTQRDLTQAQINELLPWAKDSKVFLVDLLENIQGLTTTDKVDRLVEGIKSVVGESSPKNSELLMRYALNRGLVINDILTAEMDSLAVGSQDAKLRVLISSIKMAIKYYDTDMAILSKKTVAPYVIFGLDYFDFLSELNKSIFDASAQYSIQRTALEWLQWDLYRDLNNASYASQIVKINNGLKTFPNKKLTDAQSIANIRLMKKLAQQLNVKATLLKLEEEKRISQAKTEEERRLLIAKSEAEKQRIRQEAELEKLRGVRSEIEIEKVRANVSALNSSSWTSRRDAASRLSSVVGGDVTIVLLGRFINETDGDVNNVLLPALKTRIPSSLYLMKIESQDTFLRQVVDLIADNRPGGWAKRRDCAVLLGLVHTIESYKLLSKWNETESDGDVKYEIRNSLNQIERNIK